MIKDLVLNNIHIAMDNGPDGVGKCSFARKYKLVPIQVEPPYGHPKESWSGPMFITNSFDVKFNSSQGWRPRLKNELQPCGETI